MMHERIPSYDETFNIVPKILRYTRTWGCEIQAVRERLRTCSSNLERSPPHRSMHLSTSLAHSHVIGTQLIRLPGPELLGPEFPWLE